jgi:hypothetical protein
MTWGDTVDDGARAPEGIERFYARLRACHAAAQSRM